MSNIELPPWLLEKIARGESILFLGAGASFGASGKSGEKPLTGFQLRDELSDTFLGGARKEKMLAEVAEYSKNESSLYEVQKRISDLFEPLSPGEFHKKIASFRWRAIFTTNYDFIIERAYQNNQERMQNLHALIRDNDNFSDAITSLDSVPYFKIHGCLSVINDPDLPLILATEEYAKHKKNRIRLFNHLQDFGRESPIIFCGYDLADSNIQQIFYDLGDGSENRSMYVMVRPGLDKFDHSYWSQRRVIPIAATFEDFINYLDGEIPQEKRVLGKLVSNSNESLRKFIATGNPTENLRAYLQLELDHVRADMPGPGSDAEKFYRGADSSWDALRNGYDIRRCMRRSVPAHSCRRAGAL